MPTPEQRREAARQVADAEKYATLRGGRTRPPYPTNYCGNCFGTSIGRSPTGDWCNDCGSAYPGLPCDRCGRESVNPDKHLTLSAVPCTPPAPETPQ